MALAFRRALLAAFFLLASPEHGEKVPLQSWNMKSAIECPKTSIIHHVLSSAVTPPVNSSEFPCISCLACSRTDMDMISFGRSSHLDTVGAASTDSRTLPGRSPRGQRFRESPSGPGGTGSGAAICICIGRCTEAGGGCCKGGPSVHHKMTSPVNRLVLGSRGRRNRGV